jgi:hypothetical protein
VTIGVLAASIRKVPGIRDVRRWQKKGADRLYLQFSDADPYTSIYVDLLMGQVEYDQHDISKWHGGQLWREDPRGSGQRALNEVRDLCEAFLREWKAS